MKFSVKIESSSGTISMIILKITLFVKSLTKCPGNVFNFSHEFISDAHFLFSLFSLLAKMKAVVWTDVIQIMIMYGTLILINVKGTIDAGGFSTVLQRNIDSERLGMPE